MEYSIYILSIWAVLKMNGLFRLVDVVSAVLCNVMW
jgi:hypothetical protein